MLLINGSYLVCLCMRACSGNMSWHYVNSMNCIVCVGDGNNGVGVWFDAPIMLRMSSLHLAWHWQVVCEHVHFMNHSGTICSWVRLLKVPAFVSV